MPPLNRRISSIYPPNTGEYVSPFTAPAMPNVSTQGAVVYMPNVADSAFIPRSPLPPQKLAKLANAFGISTPLPASSSPASANKRSSPSPRPSEDRTPVESRTATPSSSTSRRPASRYLIHVVPPKHYPHENRKDPGAFAAFRRGSLVPLQATLQAQLSAIAREFQLPTTHGIVLYLVNESETNGRTRTPLGKGPRISEDVWKWLWTKVADEQPVMRGVGLGFSSGTSTPAQSERPLLLRKRSAPAQLDVSQAFNAIKYPLTPSPSSPTSTTATSNIPQEETKGLESPEQSGSTNYYSTSSFFALDTPGSSSFDLDQRLLPGLGSSSLMPVLAKIEFDIDRKVGTWYETWSRSRKSLHKRRAKNLDTQGKLQLRITINNKKGTISPLSSSSESDEEDDGYEQLSDSADALNPEDELTARVSSRRRDPLDDVFGTDGEAWSEMGSGRPGRKANGDLALDGASLSVLDDPENPDRSGVSDDEVMALWNAHDQPQLRGPGLQMQRNNIPPPLNLATRNGNLEINIATATPSPYSSSSFDGSTHLPYLSDRPESQLIGEDGTIKDKRVGGIYDDVELNLGADIDMDEHRAAQLKMREELDILERNLAQFSPRALTTTQLAPETSPSNIYQRSAPPQKSTFPSSAQSLHGVSQSLEIGSSESDSKCTDAAGRQIGRTGPGVVQGVEGNVKYGTPELQAAWPAVPYTALANRGEGDPMKSPTVSLHSLRSPRNGNSPPKVVLNGSANGETKVGYERRNNSSVSSMLSTLSGPRDASESMARSKQYEEEAGFYSEAPKLPPSLSRRQVQKSESPVMPLSPDPFGRFPSAMGIPPERTSSLANGPRPGPNMERISKAPSSRFSVDSVGEDPQSLKVNKSSNIVSMKSIKKLWRKTNKASSSGTSTPVSPDPSTMPSRPPSSAASMWDTEMDVSRTPSPSVPFPSGTTRQKPPRKSSRDSGLDPFYFDQDAKYPTRRTPSPSPQQAYQFPPSPGPQPGVSGTPTAEKKRSVRKSLVNKWKNGSEGSSSADSISEPRRRRPSVLDVTGLIRSGNGSVSSTSILSSPSVPDLPAEYRMSQHSRVQSRSSMSNMLTSFTSSASNDERAFTRRKPAAQSSTDSSQESASTIPTPVSTVAPLSFGKGRNKSSASGSGTLSIASPGDMSSDGVPSSFDDSQFEMVSPLVGHP